MLLDFCLSSWISEHSTTKSHKIEHVHCCTVPTQWEKPAAVTVALKRPTVSEQFIHLKIANKAKAFSECMYWKKRGERTPTKVLCRRRRYTKSQIYIASSRPRRAKRRQCPQVRLLGSKQCWRLPAEQSSSTIKTRSWHWATWRGSQVYVRLGPASPHQIHPHPHLKPIQVF